METHSRNLLLVVERRKTKLNLNTKCIKKEHLTKHAYVAFTQFFNYVLLPGDQSDIHAHGPKLPSPQNVAGGAHLWHL